MTYDGVPHVSLLHLSRDPRPADPARRLVEDLRHDRLAAGLVGLAEAALRRTSASSRSTPIPASTRATQWAGIAALDRAAGLRAPRWSPSSTGAGKIVVEGLNGLPGVSCITPEGRLLRLPERLADRLEGQGAGLDAARGGRRRRRSAARISASTARAIIRLSYANSAENIRRALERMGDFLETRKAA